MRYHVSFARNGKNKSGEGNAYTLEQSLRQDPAAKEQQDISGTNKE